MKVAVYNEHLATAGGGEKYMGSIIEHLIARGHSVDLISTRKIDPTIFDRLNVDMESCRSLDANDFGISVSKKSAEYDLFLNVTYQSQLIPKAKCNAIVIFFPIVPRFPALARSRVLHYLLNFVNAGKDAEFVYGIYAEEKIGAYHKRRYGNWSKKEFAFKLLRKSSRGRRAIEVTIHTLPLRKGSLQDHVAEVKVGNRAAEYSVRQSKIVIRVRPEEAEKPIVVGLKAVFKPDRDSRELGIFISHISMNSGAKALVTSALRIVFHDILSYDYLTHYDLVLAISQYTKSWLKRLWNRDSVMLFPLVDTEKFTAREDKKRMIVSCGRFFAGGHNKKHLFMIKMFKGLYDDGKLPRWEYHLCGGSHPEKIHQEYLDKVKAATAGYPIFVHEDIDFKSLKNLYADATVFWHAAGFGESEKSHPDKFEHFGITTVEAMSAGCIPLVINRGGQTEIVADGINGFLFDTTDEMMEKMIRIANMKDEARKTLSVRAQMDAARFSRKAFAERMDEILCLMNQTNRDA